MKIKHFKTICLVLAIVAAIPLLSLVSKKHYEYGFQDPNLSIETRVNDLVSRLTLEEKVGQMLNSAPAIDRLSIPAYNWWNECLHGVARTPFKVTVYPQAIGMAATFDKNSLHTMADYTA
jgi:beta-glucosidase